MTESEIWKDVVGYDGYYQVSDRGNVRSVTRKDSIGRKIGGRILKPRYNRGGYLLINLCKNGKVRTKLIHRLVAEGFIPNPESLPQINHIDEVKDNINHGTSIERRIKAQSKKIRAVNIKTGEVLTFNSTAEAGRKGFNSGGVSSASRGAYKDSKTKELIGDGHTYRGYRWSYIEEGE